MLMRHRLHQLRLTSHCLSNCNAFSHVSTFYNIVPEWLIIMKIWLGNDCVWFFLLFLVRQLSSEWDDTRIEALHWLATLLDRHRAEVISDTVTVYICFVLSYSNVFSTKFNHKNSCFIIVIIKALSQICFYGWSQAWIEKDGCVW